MPKYGVLGIHAEPYAEPMDPVFATNHIWDRDQGRITIRYCTLPGVKQINETSVMLSEVPPELLTGLTRSVNAILEYAIPEAQESECNERNAYFIDR